MAGKKTQAQLTPEEKLQQALVPTAEQPYKVPANWCWTRLGIINTYNERHIDPSKNLQEFFELYSVVSYVNSYPELVNGSVIGSTKLCVQKNDVLLCKINPRINRVWKVEKYTDNILIASSEWIVIRNEKFISDYLLWCFRSEYFRKYMMLNVSGVGGSLMRAKPKFVKTYPIPLPPLAEQQRIVERIESLFAKLDEAKENLQNVLDGFETRKAAILHKAFTGELTANWRKQHGVSMDSWEEKALGKIVKNIKDKYEPTLNNKKCIKYIGLEHIEKNNGIIGFGSSDDVKSLKTIFELGDILYGKLRPYLNKHDIAKFSGICSTDILVYRAEDFNTAKFINYFMNTEKFIFYTVSNSKGINLPRISEKEVSGILVNVPTLSEQSEIVRIIDDLLAKEQQAKKLAENTFAKIDLIKKAILARAFRGELGTNNPADEPAVELLKRVL